MRGELPVPMSAWREVLSLTEILALSGLVAGCARKGRFKHVLDCLLGHDDPLAEAEAWQLAGAGHLVGEGSADPEEFSRLLNSEGQSFLLHRVILGIDRRLWKG